MTMQCGRLRPKIPLGPFSETHLATHVELHKTTYLPILSARSMRALIHLAFFVHIYSPFSPFSSNPIFTHLFPLFVNLVIFIHLFPNVIVRKCQ